MDELDSEGCICINGICFAENFFSAEQWSSVHKLMDSAYESASWKYTCLDWSKFKNKASIIRKLHNA